MAQPGFDPVARLHAHQAALSGCRRCPDMIGPVIQGRPVASKILQIGQAPGPYEGRLGQPFAWTAGKTLFKWYATLGVDEAEFRAKVYMAAVCRCFPGKNPKGGDRVPDPVEVANCARWLDEEIRLLRPRLLIPVGKLAISRFLPLARLDAVIGQTQRVWAAGHEADLIALPHPSGASTWHRMEPGRTLLAQALARIEAHPAWREVRR
jgi:uracil-DNA glycosylase